MKMKKVYRSFGNSRYGSSTGQQDVVLEMMHLLIKEQRQEVRPVTGILPMISRLYPEKMDLEQEELS